MLLERKQGLRLVAERTVSPNRSKCGGIWGLREWVWERWRAVSLVPSQLSSIPKEMPRVPALVRPAQKGTAFMSV